MARIRSIKPEFFTSEAVAALSFRARLTWIGLWTHVDDEGRCRDNPTLIRSAIWPLDDVEDRDVNDDLIELQTIGRIMRYTVDGRRYIQVTNWHEHQHPNRASPSKHPGPEGGTEVPVTGAGGVTESSLSSHGVHSESSNGQTGSQQVTGDSEDSLSHHGGLTSGGEGRGGERRGRAREDQDRQSRPLPDDWEPHNAHYLLARQRGLDCEREADQFRAYTAAHGKTYVNPHEAFRYWLGNSSTPRRPHLRPVTDWSNCDGDYFQGIG